MSYEDFSKSFFLIQGFCGVLVSKNLTLLINYDIQKYVNIANVKKFSFFISSILKSFEEEVPFWGEEVLRLYSTYWYSWYWTAVTLSLYKILCHMATINPLLLLYVIYIYLVIVFSFLVTYLLSIIVSYNNLSP